MIVFNPRAIPEELRNVVRRHKWRLRPLKRLVLPTRRIRRAAAESLGKILGRTPLRLEQSTLDYASTHTEISVREIHATEIVCLPPPPFQPNSSGEREESAPAFVFEIPNVTFWGHYGGAVVTADNALLADLSPEVWGAAQHPIFSRWRLPRSRLRNGRIGIAVTPEASGNYYRWLLDLLPRILLLKRATHNFSNYDAVFLNGSRASYEGETLAALQLPSEIVSYVGSRDRFQIASAVIPSMNIDAVAPWKVRALRELAPPTRTDARRRLYLSRAHAPVRRIANENEISAELRRRDFEVIEPEKLSWRQQVDLFAGATLIVAAHSAALSNIVFCRPGTHIVEITTRAGYRDCFWRLAGVAGLAYQVLEAQPTRASARPVDNADMIVNRDELARVLSAAE